MFGLKAHLPVIERESNMIINKRLRKRLSTNMQNMTTAFEGAVISNNSPLTTTAATELPNTAGVR